MAKKFKKFLLFATAVGTAAAAAHYYLQKKDSENDSSADEDYDDFSDASEDAADDSRSYVPLNRGGETACAKDAAAPENAENSEKDAGSNAGASKTFTPLKETLAEKTQPADTVEAVEEFFDEEDAPGEEPPLTDN